MNGFSQTGTATILAPSANPGMARREIGFIATFSMSVLSYGSQFITAEYAGNSFFSGSTSAELIQQIDLMMYLPCILR
jgi:hypothetical protein